MTLKEQEKAIRLFALLVVAICMIIIMLMPTESNAQSGQVRYHQKLQKELSFTEWEKNQPKIRIKAVKLAVNQSKAVNGNKNKMAKLVRREDAIRKRIVT